MELPGTIFLNMLHGMDFMWRTSSFRGLLLLNIILNRSIIFYNLTHSKIKNYDFHCLKLVLNFHFICKVFVDYGR